jgi:hypothetical protein
MGAVHIAGLDHLSPSGASVLVDCERRYWHRYHDGLGKDERSEPLAMGGGLAAALEFNSNARGIEEYLARRPVADGWTDPIAYEREEWAAKATIRGAHLGYSTRYPEPVEREITYFCTLPNVDRLLQVRVDGVGDGYLVEDKLRSGSSMRADTIENEVRQGRQITAEVYGHWRTTGDILPVKLRCTRKCDPRKWKKLETALEVAAVIGEHFDSEGVFNEFTCTRTREQLVEFEAEFAALAVRAEALLKSDTPIGARNTGACHAYGRSCPALAICQGLTTTEENHGAA